VERKLITDEEGIELVASVVERLGELGVEAPRLPPEHLLMSIGPDQELVRTEEGAPDFRLCNLQFLRWKNPPD